MTNEQLYEILGNISEKHIKEAREVPGKKITNLRLTVLAASFVLCICLAGVTALASSEKVRGFFKDIKRIDGAVIGTAYEQATGEVELQITEVSDTLTLEINMLYPQTAPYRFFELFGVNNYQISDLQGTVIVDEATSEMTSITDGKVIVTVPLNDLSNGEYKLIVHELIGSSKADQPLVLSGTWECEFQVN